MLLVALVSMVLIDFRLRAMPDSSRLSILDFGGQKGLSREITSRQASLTFLREALGEGNAGGISETDRIQLIAHARALRAAAPPMMWAQFRILERLNDADTNEFDRFCASPIVRRMVVEQGWDSLRQMAEEAFAALPPHARQPASMPASWNPAQEKAELRQRWSRLAAVPFASYVTLESVNKALILWLLERDKTQELAQGHRALLYAHIVALLAAAERAAVVWDELRRSVRIMPGFQSAAVGQDEDVTFDDMVTELDKTVLVPPPVHR